LIEEAKNAASAEAEKVKASALAEIEQEKNRAKAELRAELASLTFQGAEKVLGAAIDQSAHADLVSKLTAELH
jgi:F-type H+-transporting ATPase subunit b